MGFKIHYKGRSFTAIEFSRLSLPEDDMKEEYVVNAVNFTRQWVNDLPFTFYSSGSTGKPKPFTFTKKQLQLSAQMTIEALGLRDQSNHILLCLNPRFVGGAMMLARAFELDCELTLHESKRDILDFLSDGHPYTFASFVSGQLLNLDKNLLKFNRFNQILIGGSVIFFSLEEQLNEVSPLCFHTYGMTETLSHIALRRIGKEDSFWPLPHIDIKLNNKGCLCIKTNFISDWIETNDVVELQSDGSFKFTGRTDFVINSGGYKIHPEKVENEIHRINEEHHLIAGEFIVLGLSDVRWGEKCVCVVNQKIEAQSFARLQEMLQEKLHKYEIPKDIVRINGWKYTANGKIDRKAIRELIDNQTI